MARTNPSDEPTGPIGIRLGPGAKNNQFFDVRIEGQGIGIDNQGEGNRFERTEITHSPVAARLPRGYLDTNLISGLVNGDLGSVEQAALTELLRLRKAGTVALCTSEVAAEEIGRNQSAASRRHEDIYLLLDEVPKVDEQFQMSKVYGAGLYGADRYGMGPIVEDATLGVLRSIVPDADDARHLFQAAKNGIDYFVTRDERTIVKHAAAIQAAAGIRVRLPSQLVAELALKP